MVDSTAKSNGVLADKTASDWIIIPRPVVIKPALAIHFSPSIFLRGIAGASPAQVAAEGGVTLDGLDLAVVRALPQYRLQRVVVVGAVDHDVVGVAVVAVDHFVDHRAAQVLVAQGAVAVVNGFQVFAFQIVTVGQTGGFLNAITRWVVAVLCAVDLFDAVVGGSGYGCR